MIKLATKSRTQSEDCKEMEFRYEFQVPKTSAFASTATAMQMVQRYLDHLKIDRNNENQVKQEHNHAVDGTRMHTYRITFISNKWPLKQKRFEYSHRSMKDAQRKCAVDIIRALREEGIWDMNLVPVEVLRRKENMENAMLQKQRALFQSVDIEQVNVPSVLEHDFEIESGEDKMGYLYHLEIEKDPNKFPLGIVLPRKLPDELLHRIKFPVFIRQRDERAVGDDLQKYATFIHEQLNEIQDPEKLEERIYREKREEEMEEKVRHHTFSFDYFNSSRPSHDTIPLGSTFYARYRGW